MKHKKLIVAALLATTLLSGCGGKSTEVMAPVENQESVQQNTVEVDGNWWNGKVFQSENGNGVCLWGEYRSGVIAFYLGKDTVTIKMGVVYEEDYTVLDNGNILYKDESFDEPPSLWSLAYNPDNDVVSFMEEDKATGEYTSLCGTYKLITQEQQPTETPEQPDLSNNTEFPEFSNWECFETFSGEDITISIEVQSGDPVMILPEAKFIVLERNGADTGWEFINEDFTDNRVYTTVTYYGDKLVISSTEDWKWDGTYIQLPDTTE